MKYTFIERPPDTHQQSLSREQIRAMCKSAFGCGKDPEEVQELHCGEYNNTYLITFTDSQQIILRVSPALSGVTCMTAEIGILIDHSNRVYS
jgi:aminoglycoside phosphotransferase (APT) family kinase protein